MLIPGKANPEAKIRHRVQITHERHLLVGLVRSSMQVCEIMGGFWRRQALGATCKNVEREREPPGAREDQQLRVVQNKKPEK